MTSRSQQRFTPMRLLRAAVLLCAMIAEAILAPPLRLWSAQLAALDAELSGVLCSQHRDSAPVRPERPGREHCADMACCLASQRTPWDDGLGGPIERPALPVPPAVAQRVAWSAPGEAAPMRSIAHPRQARAPPV